MNFRIGMPMVGILALTACAPESSIPNGSVVYDGEVQLVRVQDSDRATREITVDRDGVVVAIVDEQLADVKLKLAAVGANAAQIKPVEVESGLGGAGFEIAVLAVPRGARLVASLTGRQDFAQPGKVKLQLRYFDADAAHDRAVGKLFAGYQEWSAATAVSLTAADVQARALPAMERAIQDFSGAHDGARLAAQARFLEANTLERLQIDPRRALAAARDAAREFSALQPADEVFAARSRLVEARALSAISLDSTAVDPTSSEAASAARDLLAGLSGETSALGPIGRAHALLELAQLDVGAALIEDGSKRLAAARELYLAAGYVEGDRVVRVDQAQALVEQGRFAEGAKAFVDLLPEIDRMSNASRRVIVMLGAGRALSFTGKSDEALDLLLRAQQQARADGLRLLEASAVENISFAYWDRGDQQQAIMLNAQALNLLRPLKDSTRLAYALETGGSMARNVGNYDQAIKMHREAVAYAIQPVPRVRALRSLGVDYMVSGNYPECEKQLRASLAVKLENPRHNAYNDVKRNLAELFVDYLPDPSPAQLAEAGLLVEEAKQRARASGDTMALIGALRATAVLKARQGKTKEALAEYDNTFRAIFEYRRKSSNSSVRTGAVAHEQEAFRSYFDLVMKGLAAQAGKVRPATALETRALRLLEVARESHFGAPRIGAMDPAAAAHADQLLTLMGEKSLRIATLLRQPQSPENSHELETLQTQMSGLRMDLDRTRTGAAQKVATTEKISLESRRPWRPVAPHTVQLSYAFGDGHAYVWARSASGLRVAALSERAETLEPKLKEFAKLDAQAAPARIEELLAQLSPVLLPPGLLAPDSDALEIVADGRVAVVPFGGLASPVAANRRLAQTHGITLISSMYSSAEPRSPQPRPFRLVALASGNGALRSAATVDTGPRLQAAVNEIQAIGVQFTARDPAARIKLLSGGDGSAETLRGIWSSGADVVHFATHAMADPRQPLASLLVLPATDAKGTATYLTAGQVQEWRGDAQLVFLSACESAVGPPRFASGMPGLQSAFLRAGAQGVIATLWPIEDVLAREFSADFYQRFTHGQSAAEALRDTQRQWLAPKPGASDAEMQRRRITALAHGFYTR